VVFFNLIGLGMLALSAAAAFGVAYLLGASGETPFLLIAGPIALACDVAYRWKHPRGHWLHPNKGGSFCFVPVWVFGALWLVLGIARTLTGQDRAGMLDAVIVGLAVLILLGVAIARAAPADAPPPADASSPPPPHAAADWECSRCGQKNAGRVRVCERCQLQI
jgi:hypothetical protein